MNLLDFITRRRPLFRSRAPEPPDITEAWLHMVDGPTAAWRESTDVGALQETARCLTRLRERVAERRAADDDEGRGGP